MINYLAVDNKVFKKKLTFRDLGSRRNKSFSESGKFEEPEVEIEIAEDEPLRRNRSTSLSPGSSRHPVFHV